MVEEGPKRGYRLYVIELSQELAEKFAEKKPCVYVGQSWHSAEVRFEQHKAGIRSNRKVQEYGVRLRPEYYEELPTFEKKHQAERAERKLGNRLKARGFRVFGPQFRS